MSNTRIIVSFIGVALRVLLGFALVAFKESGDALPNTELRIEDEHPDSESASNEEQKKNAFDFSVPTLNLSNRRLNEVPTYVFEETDVEALDLSGNQLSGALPAEIQHLQSLKILDLSDNNFTGVPAEVGQLTKLEVLDLSNNPITGLPYEIGNLKNLRVLDLRGTDYAIEDLEIISKGLRPDIEIKE